VVELQGELEEAETRAGALKEQVAVLEAARDAEAAKLQGELEEAETRAGALQEQVAALEAARDAEAAKLQGELEEAKTRAGALQEQVAALEAARDATVVKLEATLQKERSEIASLNQKMARCEGRVSSLEKRLSDLRSQREDLKTQLDEMKSTHTAMVRDLQSQIQNKEVTISALKEKLSISFVDRILFDFGKATISPQGREILAKVGTILKNVGAKQVRVVGHTDNKPIHPDYRYKFPSNWELSAARAAAVVRYFQHEIGLDPENLEAVGRSFYDPVASNNIAEGRAQNRRVNIVIAPKLK
jgi:chemotaxis protein MotB